MPSAMSTRTTTLASSFSAMRCAVVAPTFPAPTTVILLTIEARDVMGELRQRAEVIGGVWRESIGMKGGNRESGIGNGEQPRDTCRVTLPTPDSRFPIPVFPLYPPTWLSARKPPTR